MVPLNAVILVMSLLLLPAAALGDEALDRKRAGDQAMVALRFDDALAAYEEAYRLGPAPALKYNIGRALEGLGRYPEALEALEAFGATAPADVRARVPDLAGLLRDLRRRVTELRVVSNVDGARVLVRDRAVGVTPLPAPLRVTAGQAAVEVLADGYQPFRRLMQLPGNAALTLDAPLLPRDRAGVLEVRSNVPLAEVSVDGRPLGHAPAEVALPAGTHRARLTRDGFEPLETTTVLGVGERKTLELRLVPRTPIYKRWWFWTAVAAAAGAATAALLIERPAGEGDLPPRRISAPLVTF